MATTTRNEHYLAAKPENGLNPNAQGIGQGLPFPRLHRNLIDQILDLGTLPDDVVLHRTNNPAYVLECGDASVANDIMQAMGVSGWKSNFMDSGRGIHTDTSSVNARNITAHRTDGKVIAAVLAGNRSQVTVNLGHDFYKQSIRDGIVHKMFCNYDGPNYIELLHPWQILFFNHATPHCMVNQKPDDKRSSDIRIIRSVEDALSVRRPFSWVADETHHE